MRWPRAWPGIWDWERRRRRSVALDPAVSQRRYLEALGHLRRYDSEQSLDNAIAILDDLGTSPSVQAALARAYLYKFQITRQPELAAQAAQAADRALKGDAQSVDVNVTLGRALSPDRPLPRGHRRIRPRPLAATQQRRRRTRTRRSVQRRRRPRERGGLLQTRHRPAAELLGWLQQARGVLLRAGSH